MAEPFKNLIDGNVVRDLARHLRRSWRGFAHDTFVAAATASLGALELKARVQHVSRALDDVLPEAFADAAAVLERSLAPARDDTDLGALRTSDEGLAGWAVWPLCDYVARRGLATPERALAALHAMTQRLTAEYAIRPFLRVHPALTFATLHRWCADPSAHVRRLVSEGSRPRLPWGEVLRDLVADPSPTLPLLERLQDDPSEYVRRSVANHLNDIAKDHPAVVASWIERHLPDAGRERAALLRHAARTLVKRGDRRVLAAFGLGTPLRGRASLAIAPTKVRRGGRTLLSVALESTSSKAQKLVVDYVVHHVKADGTTSPKVWKGWRLELGPHERRELQKAHSCKPVTTRVDRPGRHAVDLQVNGKVVASAAFELSG